MYPQLVETIAAQMESTDLTGLVIALVRGDETIWSKSYGVANIETGKPLTTETLCGIMSVTKPIVGTAVLQLRDAGEFELDDPINRYLAPVSIKNEWEDETPVTVRQLLTHTGGLPVGVGADPPGRHPLAEYVDLTARTTWRPGSQMVYANWGYAALGLLIERCSGQPVGEYFRENIFVPLGMDNTVYGPPSGERATGHFVSRLDRSTHTLPMDEWPVIPTSPAGGCWATVLDLAKFIIAHLDSGDGILKPETTREMHEVHAALGARDGGMGLGFRVTRSNGRTLVCHGGDGGGFTAFAGFYPNEGVGVALLINTGGMQTARSVISNTALGLMAGQTKRRRAPATSGVRAGVYRSTFWEIEVEVRDADPPTLTTTEGLVVADEAGVSSLTPVAAGSYQGEGGMFHGFEIGFEHGDDPRFRGGVYPFTFIWDGDLVEPPPIDETDDLTGEWQGSVHTPMGQLALTLQIVDAASGKLSTPMGPALLSNFRARSGRVEADFPLDIPGVGEFRNFLRVAARGGRLAGKTYSRSKFGETVMPTELERA